MTHTSFPRIYLVSACLVGLKTRYDGCIKPDSVCINELSGSIWVPVCPEQLGGLSTPRTAADIIGGDGNDVLEGNALVVTEKGEDVTEQFVLGAKQVLKIAESQKIAGIYLKARSPSCGITSQPGVTAALLISRGYEVREF
ncbi:MAG: DUF523 domain-containing protein [Thermodesulfobacteriota bacterium]|nr:DUF523 domain-containing protein [Thermodesulfobacteriota bacterium]